MIFTYRWLLIFWDKIYTPTPFKSCLEPKYETRDVSYGLGGVFCYGDLRYCVPGRTKSNTGAIGVHNACKQLQDTQSDVQCVVTTDRLECFHLLSKGEVDFTVAEPEDLRFLSQLSTQKNFNVTHELLKYPQSQPQKNVEMVTVVKKNSNESWISAGKKLCYSGLDLSHRPQFDHHYTTYFEGWLFGDRCDSDKTILENRMASLSEHFDSACIAGPWSLDPDLDALLKNKYKNLCKLCFEPDSCNKEDRYYGFNGALNCLLEGGDISWLTSSTLASNAAGLSQLSNNGYSLLCPDGMSRSLTGNDTCSWIEDLRPVLVANKNAVKEIWDKVGDGKIGSKIVQTIRASYMFESLRKLDKADGVKDYLIKFPGYSTALIKSHAECSSKREVRWCVADGVEARKCRSLEQATVALALAPELSCVARKNRKECLQALVQGDCDVLVADTTEMATIDNNTGVKPILDIISQKNDDFNNIAAIVRKNSSFKNYDDLKGAKACFTSYQSVGWNIFYKFLKNESDTYDCKDIEAISSYFKESCVLGTETSNKKFPPNLYSLCNKSDSKLDIGERTFECLVNGADVAFLNVGMAKSYALKRQSMFNVAYRILGPSSKEECSQNPIKCILARVTLGSILVHERTPKTREEDITSLFLALDRYFGRTYDRETPLFQLYEPFEGKPNVIFSNKTIKLKKIIPGLPVFNQIQNSNKSKCETSKSTNINPNEFTIIVFSVINLVLVKYFIL